MTRKKDAVERAAELDRLVATAALIAGKMCAREVFRQRGDHAEAHMTEVDLAGVCAAAFHLGYEAAEKTAEAAAKAGRP